MAIRTIPLLFAVALAAAACTEPPPAPAPEPDHCGASRLQPLVGADESALRLAVPQSANLRVIRPGMAVTMDHMPFRLNAEVDRYGRILRLFCG